MDSVLKQRWVATLRSGNYEQGKYVLRNRKNQCCCLGVLCDMVDPKGWAQPKTHGGYRHHSLFQIPNIQILSKVELSQSYVDALVSMNDTGASFTAIADWIERNVP